MLAQSIFGRRTRNSILLFASYVFYSAWDWRFLSLILISTVSDFVIGRYLHRSDGEHTRRRWLVLSIFINLSILGFFKYFNFFVDGFVQLLAHANVEIATPALHIVLPVGISFYTFQTMSYTIDVYRRKIEPEPELLNFAVFVAMFPQLVAGPIERAANLLPQIRRATLRCEDYTEAFSLIAWGLFKKVVVADNLAMHVDRVYGNYHIATGPDVYLATIAFAVQIYADFSAYTDIARGSAKLFGLELMENFRRPYLAVSPQDFWRRWHISLSTWLRDYLYFGLGGNRRGGRKIYRNLLITMVLGGLWHGASWNFLWWGAYHGVLLAGHRYLSGSRWWLKLPTPLAWFFMMHLTLLGWLLFRCANVAIVDGNYIDQSGEQLRAMLMAPWAFDVLTEDTLNMARDVMLFSAPLFATEYLQTRSGSVIPYLTSNVLKAVAISGVLLFFVLRYAMQSTTAFIYYQF